MMPGMVRCHQMAVPMLVLLRPLVLFLVFPRALTLRQKPIDLNDRPFCDSEHDRSGIRLRLRLRPLSS